MTVPNQVKKCMMMIRVGEGFLVNYFNLMINSMKFDLTGKCISQFKKKLFLLRILASLVSNVKCLVIEKDKVKIQYLKNIYAFK